MLSRRAFLAGSTGAAGLLLAGRSGLARSTDLRAAPVATQRTLHLAATDGWVSMPRSAPTTAFWPDPWAPSPYDMYVFGFRNVTGLSDADVTAQRGLAQISAPVMAFDEYVESQANDVRVTLTNLGLTMRPDLTDGHTIHWHGFVNAIPIFDGVPELSISVPIGRSFTYYYRPHDPGTYMYHCHFEDVEHVQMGMTGVVYVRPKQNGTAVGAWDFGRHQKRYAYNDADGSTQYDREFSFMINEIWSEAHFRDAHIQTTDWTDFAPSFWTLNGRCFPDTVKGNGDPLATDADGLPDGEERLRYQPISSLITCNSGDRVLLRLANLGYQNHTMTCDQIPLTMVAKDSVRLSNGGTNHYIEGTSVEIGPGESRDVIFTAPAVSSTTTFLFYDRNYAYLNNGGGTGYGGQLTHIEVHPSGVPAQDIDKPNS
jgi:FtsP/CotA-like multicopper oxidase with cupredoxin domain